MFVIYLLFSNKISCMKVEIVFYWKEGDDFFVVIVCNCAIKEIKSD
jgi:hypothetical protein